jgi:hypothetical protein
MSTGSRGRRERLVLEHRCRLQQSLVPRQICDVVAKSGDEQRPLVEQPHDHDSPGIAGAIGQGTGVEIAAGVDLAGDGDQPERVVVLDVDRDAAAIEQDITADIVLEILQEQRLAVVGAILRLPGQDQARGFLGVVSSS